MALFVPIFGSEPARSSCRSSWRVRRRSRALACISSGRERRSDAPAPGLICGRACSGRSCCLRLTAIQPMSDVPATLLAARGNVGRRTTSGSPRAAVEGRFSPLAAWPQGICAGMAILTRPALLPAVLVLLAITWFTKRDRASAWSLRRPHRPSSCAIQIWLNAYAVRQPRRRPDMARASHMFELSVSRMAANVSNFGKWLTSTHTRRCSGCCGRRPLWFFAASRWAWQLSAVAAAAAAALSLLSSCSTIGNRLVSCCRPSSWW